MYVENLKDIVNCRFNGKNKLLLSSAIPSVKAAPH